MTTTPAPNDHDTLKALLDAMPEGPWRVAQSQPHPGIRTAAGWEVVWATYADTGPKVLEFIAAARNALPALLDELGKTRADNEWYHETLPKVTDQRNAASVQAEQWEKRYVEMLDQRDTAIQQHAAARAELAKTRAELAARGQTFKTLWREFELNSKRMEELTEARGRLMQWAAAELGTSLIHKRIREVLGLDASVEAMALAQAAPNDVNASGERLYVATPAAEPLVAGLFELPELRHSDPGDGPCPHPYCVARADANPATTAEPADEPKATIRTALGDDWSNLLDDEPECGHDRAKADDTECPECGADLAALDDADATPAQVQP